MKPINVWTYIKVGTGFRYLQDATKGRRIHGESFILENIERFLKMLDDFQLHVTNRASDRLRKVQEKLSLKSEDAALSAAEAEELKEAIKAIRATFSAETKGIYNYVVTEKRLDVEKLLNDMKGLFAPGTFDQLSDIAQSDFKSAGRCIAFECSTAAAFHLLRGIEGILRQYYVTFIGPATSDITWGHITVALRKKRDKRIDNHTLRHLDHIRSAFRNPTQHPEKTYDTQEIQDLFPLIVDVTNRMINEMNLKLSASETKAANTIEKTTEKTT